MTIKIIIAVFVILFLLSHEPGRIFLRFMFTPNGRKEPKTNATWFREGDKILHRSGRATRWHFLPGYKRVLYKNEIAFGIVGGIYLYFAHPIILVSIAVTAATVTLTIAAYIGNRQYKEFVMTRDILRPIHKMLTPLVDQTPNVAPKQWIDVPADYVQNDSAKVTITMPEGFAATAEHRKVIPPLISARLGGEWDGEFKMQNRHPILLMSRAPAPPPTVGIDDIRAEMLSAPEYAPILGVGTHDQIHSVNLQTDSPHIALSMGTGGGKSTTVRGLAVQFVRNGATVDIIDIAKMGVSHLWAKKVPAVSIWRTPETAHNALIRLESEMLGRFDEIFLDESREADFQRRIIIFEELNASLTMLKDYWKRIRTPDDPKDSPAIQGLGRIIFAGRQGLINVIMIAQSLTARALGGPELRENFAFRILARYSMNNWKMLAPEVWPAPKSSNHPGRVQFVTGGQAFATQVLSTTNDEAAEWALSGNTIPQPLQTVITTEGPVIAARTYTLAEAVRENIIPVNYENAKKIRQRHKSEFPTLPATEEELRQWFANYALNS